MDDFMSLLRSDDLIVVPQGTGEPLTLTETLAAERQRVEQMRVFVGTMFSDTFQPHHADRINFISFGGIGTVSRLVNSGACTVLPVHISALPRLFQEDKFKPDVVLLHLSGESKDGLHSYGIVDDYLSAAVKQARIVVGEVNTQMPFMRGGSTIALTDLDAVIYSDRPLLEVSGKGIDPVAGAIGELASGLVPNGACLQMGIGAVPNAVLASLSKHRDLGIHTGLMTDALYELHRSGAVTNAAKDRHRHLSIAGACFGTRALYDALHNDEAFEMRPVEETHAPELLAKIRDFVSINSAIEVDITGQVNAEIAGDAYVGAVGGQVDFVRGAAASPGGRSVIALPATTKRGTVSRIVPFLPSGVVTTSRSDVDTIITEYGVADLRGLTVQDRAEELIKIAAPQFRDALREHRSQLRGVGALAYTDSKGSDDVL